MTYRLGTQSINKRNVGSQQVTKETVEVAFVDQGYTGESAATAAESQGVRLEVVKLPEAKKGFVLLPRRWVVERTAL